MWKKKPRLLYVENDVDTYVMISFVLEGAGYEVEGEFGFAEAITAAVSERFDAFILESRLVSGSGIGLCLQLREMLPTTPIIFYSAEARPQKIDLAMRAGADAYLVKPCDPSRLVQTLSQFLSREQDNREGKTRRLA